MAKHTTPGIYTQDHSNFPPSIVPVETAIPVFIGYTEQARLEENGDLLNVPKRVTSIKEYIQHFGTAYPEKEITIHVDSQKSPEEISSKITNPSNYLMFYSLQAFYLNGGGSCYIVSVGDYKEEGIINQEALLNGLEKAGHEDEVTLIIFPDAINLTLSADYYSIIKQALNQCSHLKDRFTICDVYMHNNSNINDIDVFRNTLAGSVNELKYGAAYYPYLEMQLNYFYEDKDITVNKNGIITTLDTFEIDDNPLFHKLKDSISTLPVILPPSSALAGVYTKVDNNRGVWKAPANINIDFVTKPSLNITDQETLNVDILSGKSINAIRTFSGRGTAVVWGARTLAGNNHEWRYISTRRFFNMVEESVRKATYQFVFEPNEMNTWIKIKSMINNFLTLQWRSGALSGAKPEEAFFIKIGMGETMTENDILENKLIVEIGMAIVRPAEFIVLKFMQNMQEN